MSTDTQVKPIIASVDPIESKTLTYFQTVLISLSLTPTDSEIELRKRFFGVVYNTLDADISNTIPLDAIIYATGNIKYISRIINRSFRIILNLSFNYKHLPDYPFVSIGQVPHKVCDGAPVGIMFPEFFPTNHFDSITTEHKFQSLTESTKSGTSLRTGIYITPVTASDDTLRFRLLRCSTNLGGSTDNFRDTDRLITDAANAIAHTFFTNPADLNHILAQVYHNTAAGRARISRHSDKTKDMPADGIMAFCTFYRQSELDALKRRGFDRFYNQTSALSTLYFRLKNPDEHPNHAREFSVTLYPNSLFLIPLETNRIYTHETKPPVLQFDRMPTRLGYVIRCSKTLAIFVNDRTHIYSTDGSLIPLHIPTSTDLAYLRTLYLAENATDAVVEYGVVDYSMNAGDYIKPSI